MAIQPKKKPNRGLGRGINALMGNADVLLKSGLVNQGGVPLEIEIEKLSIARSQPRKNFNEEAMKELSNSIAEKGIIQALLVRPVKDGKYEIIAGERRYRAAKMAGIKTVPVAIKELSDKDAHEIALIENIQREDLNPMEEAYGYKTMIEEFNYTQEELAKVLGKSRSRIANTLRLISLPDDIQKKLEEGKITSGHARSLIGLEDAVEIANEIINKKLTVREVEEISKGNKQKKTSENKDYIKEIEKEFSNLLKENVKININGDKGFIKINISNKESFENIISKLK